MADNYVQFSQVLPDLKGREAAWLRRMLRTATAPALRAQGIRIDPEEAEYWPMFQWEIQGQAGHRGELWIYSQDAGSPQQVAQLVRAFLVRFRPRDCWEMTWSETCSRPRVGEFGGGAVFVTAQSARFFQAHQWAQQKSAAFARRRAR